MTADKLQLVAAPLRNDGSFGPCGERGVRRHVLVLAAPRQAAAHKLNPRAIVPDSLRLNGAHSHAGKL